MNRYLDMAQGEETDLVHLLAGHSNNKDDIKSFFLNEVCPIAILAHSYLIVTRLPNGFEQA